MRQADQPVRRRLSLEEGEITAHFAVSGDTLRNSSTSACCARNRAGSVGHELAHDADRSATGVSHARRRERRRRLLVATVIVALVAAVVAVVVIARRPGGRRRRHRRPCSRPAAAVRPARFWRRHGRLRGVGSQPLPSSSPIRLQRGARCPAGAPALPRHRTSAGRFRVRHRSWHRSLPDRGEWYRAGRVRPRRQARAESKTVGPCERQRRPAGSDRRADGVRAVGAADQAFAVSVTAQKGRDAIDAIVHADHRP